MILVYSILGYQPLTLTTPRDFNSPHGELSNAFLLEHLQLAHVVAPEVGEVLG